MDNYDGYEDFHNLDISNEDLDGLTITGNVYGDMENDAAAQWLAQAEIDAINNKDGVSYQEELIGSATNADLQLGRIKHTEPRIQAGIKAVLSGGNLDGVHPVDLAAAREEFASVIGGDVKSFAKQIKVDEAVLPPKHPKDIKTVISMLGDTAGSYLERGPGGQLVNTYGTEEAQAKADEDFQKAVGYVKDLADIYLDDRTRGTSVESSRRQALEESITKRLIDGVFYDGSTDILPLPNETGVTGIKPTQGIFTSPQGTAQDRLSAGAMFHSAYEKTNISGRDTFKRDELGRKIFKPNLTKEQKDIVLQNTPSLKNSLFPIPRKAKGEQRSKEDSAKLKRDQNFAMEQAQNKAEFARKVLRQQMPTTRDESKGQMRMTGFDAPYDEQAELQNLRNEAAILGIEWNSAYSGQNEGEATQTELTDFIEKNTEVSTEEMGRPKQGSKEWLEQRKGKITASTAAMLLKEGGVEEKALELAMERLGTNEKFLGNAHTREGNEGEKKAAQAFMAQFGKNLELREAFFEENEKHEGFGVSPDGRLYDKDGNSKGLLELKYLSSGSMNKALDKYIPQMQLQMAITGENETNFFALDKYTGDYVHEVVKADPVMQEKLLSAGSQALELSKSLDNRGVKALRKQIMNKPRGRKPLNVESQKEAFKKVEEVEEPITAFDKSKASIGMSDSNASRASDTLLAKKLMQLDQRERVNEALNQAIPESVIGTENNTRRKEQAKARAAFVEGNKHTPFNENTESSAMSDFYAKQQRDAAEATKEASQAVREFANSTKNAGKAMLEIANLVTEGNKSAMDEIRLAAETGEDVSEVRGTRKVLESGGLSDGAISSVIRKSGSMVASFKDTASLASEFSRLSVARGKSNLSEVRNLEIPSIQELKGMSPQQLRARVAGLMEDKSPEAKRVIGEMFGMKELATFQGDPETLLQIDTNINEEAQRSTRKGIVSASQDSRDLEEKVGEAGDKAGFLSRASQKVSGILDSTIGTAVGGAIGGAISSRVAGKFSSLTSKSIPTSLAGKFSSSIAKAGPKAANVMKGLSTAAKTTPVAAAATLAPTVVRMAADVEDDGGFADSGLDILEFAAYGAAAGSVVPAVGTAIGAAVGGGVGVLNEAYEYFSTDNAIPRKEIGQISRPAELTKEDDGTIVNVSVSNEISPDLISTKTDVNGDISTNLENGLGTSGQ